MSSLLDRQSFSALKSRVLTCLVHNTAVAGAGANKTFTDASGGMTTVRGGLAEHINELKAVVDKQRAEVPAMVMKQTTAHLEALQPLEGSLESVERLKEAAANARGAGRSAAVDVQRDLLERCEGLPELQTRLRNATAKLANILNQMDQQTKITGARTSATA